MKSQAPTPEQIIYLVDDDEALRDSLAWLLESQGFKVAAFASAEDFLKAWRPEFNGCLLLDVRMPGMTGLELQQHLAERSTGGHIWPIVFITGHGDIPMAVRAIKAGAVEFLAKPFRDDDLLEAIRHALERDRAGRSEAAELDEIRRKYATLTGREREVIALMVKGMLNKQAAAELGVAEITVKVHRHNIMQKMKVRSLPDLVRMMEKVNAR